MYYKEMPFRPLSRSSASDLRFPNTNLGGVPIFGIDGGVIVHSSAFRALGHLEAGSALVNYLRQKTRELNGISAISHNAESTLGFNIHRSDSNSPHFSSRGLGYFGYDYKQSALEISDRIEVFIDEVRADYDLLRNWQSVVHDLQFLSEDDRKRVLLGVWQNIANQLSTIFYMAAFLKQKNTSTVSDVYCNEVMTGSRFGIMAYYELISGSEQLVMTSAESMANIIDESMYLLHLVNSELSQKIDVLKCARETDMSHLTLEVANRIYTEFKDAAPTIVILLQGGLDLGICLELLNYPGKIVYILPSVKHDGKSVADGELFARIHEHDLDIVKQLDSAGIATNEPVIIVDDTLVTGKTVGKVIGALEVRGNSFAGIRTMYRCTSSKHEPSEDVLSMTRSYFEFPLTKRRCPDGQSSAVFQREVWRRACKKPNQV